MSMSKVRRFSLAITILVVMVAAVAVAKQPVSAAAICTPATAITVPFAKDGAGDFCYVTSSLCTYINSWNTTTVEVNGTAYTNTWVSSSSIAPVGGTYTIHYVSSVGWGHFEIGGTCGGVTPVPTTQVPVVTNTPTRTLTSPPVLTNTPTRTPTTGPSATRTATPTTGPSATRTRTPTTGPSATRTATPPAWTPTRTLTSPPVLTNTPTRTATTPPVLTNTPTLTLTSPPVLTNTPTATTGSACTGTGSISRDYWTGVSGTAVSAIPTGNTPSGSDTLASLRAVNWSNSSQNKDWADSYGQRLRGYVCAPTSGNYTFWIASDDSSELWLSPDSNSANKQKIASQTDWTNQDEWSKQSTQKSAVIALTGGTSYYIEVLHKEGGGGDNLSVGWAKPGESTSAPSEIVPGSALKPYTAGPTNTPGPSLTPTRTLTPPPGITNTPTRTATTPPGITNTPTRTPTNPPAGTHLSDPFSGINLYVNPHWQGSTKGFAVNTSVWLDTNMAVDGSGGYPLSLLGHIDAAIAQGRNAISIVVYNLPGRDCAALASNGLLPGTEAGLTTYKTQYIDPIAAAVAARPNIRVIAIIEPDSLPNLVTNLSDPDCQSVNSQTLYQRGTSYALNKFEAIPNMYTYLDIGHAGWLGWPSNFNPAITLISNVIKAGNAGGNCSDCADGFADGTANTQVETETFLDAQTSVGGNPVRSSAYFDWNDYIDESHYATAWKSAMQGAGIAANSTNMVLDTSRNGWGGCGGGPYALQTCRPTATSTSTDLNTYVNQSRIDRRPAKGDWCNQNGAGLGKLPGPGTAPYVYYLWIKPPAESDGSSSLIPTGPDNPDGKGFDQMCDPNYMGNSLNQNKNSNALPNAPVSGRWFQAQWDQLVANKFP